jgi:orotidine-5'-phosphate decarboxylase
MGDRNFREMIEARWAADRFVCVGLDSEYEKIPEAARKDGVVETIVLFNRAIVEATAAYACAFKPNIAFYEAYGDYGLIALQRTILDIHKLAPEVPVILDAKRADIGNTNMGYVREAFDFLHADAVTVHPYLGAEALAPFLELKDKGIIVLCRTSNPGAGELQDLQVGVSGRFGKGFHHTLSYVPFHQYVAHKVATAWNKNGNCAVVVGATYPRELAQIREIVGDIPILIPGIGAQGGDVEKTVKAGMNSHSTGMIINSSRGIIFASKGNDFVDAARRETIRLHDLINQYRTTEVS